VDDRACIDAKKKRICVEHVENRTTIPRSSCPGISKYQTFDI
jgi:hypothetical protein